MQQRRAFGNVTDAILAHLKNGPRTKLQLAALLGAQPNTVAKAMTRLIAAEKRGPRAGLRRVHISEWTREGFGHGRFYPRPIYSYGHVANKPPPSKLSGTVLAQRWRANVAARQAEQESLSSRGDTK